MEPKAGKPADPSASEVLDAMFDLDPAIRFVAVYHEQYLLAGGMRNGTLSFDPDEDARKIDLQLSKMGEIAESWQHWFGHLDVVVLRYQKLHLVLLPLKVNRFFIFSASVKADPYEIARKIRESRSFQELSRSIP